MQIDSRWQALLIVLTWELNSQRRSLGYLLTTIVPPSTSDVNASIILGTLPSSHFLSSPVSCPPLKSSWDLGEQCKLPVDHCGTQPPNVFDAPLSQARKPSSPFPSNTHHRSNGDCLKGKRENYQVCSVQYCAQQLYTVNCTHIWTELSSLDWVLSHWAHFTVLRFIFVYVFFCVWLYIACMCSIVTWWGGPGGIEAWSLGPLLPSVLWHCWLGHLTRKTRPRYDL